MGSRGLVVASLTMGGGSAGVLTVGSIGGDEGFVNLLRKLKSILPRPLGDEESPRSVPLGMLLNGCDSCDDPLSLMPVSVRLSATSCCSRAACLHSACC
jgi:hypothetical protein